MSKTKNILVITYWSYRDALIQAYTLPYVRIIKNQLPEGSKIFLVTLEQEQYKMSFDECSHVKEQLKQEGIHLLDFTYHKFGMPGLIYAVGFFFRLLSVILSNKIKFIHAWCTPAGAIGYILSKLTGKPLIIDSYEPHAEAMVENGTWGKGSLQFRILFYFEKKMSRHASIIISATEAMRDYAKEKYSVILNNFYVKPACVNEDFFSPSHRKKKELMNELDLDDKIVCVYAGKFGGIYLTREVFDFFVEAKKLWGEKFRVLLLTSHSSEELFEMAKASGFNKDNMIVKFVAHADIADYMGLADFAITPVKPIPTKRYCTPIKDGEYWALGLPVVITKNISDDSGIIEKNNIGAVIENFSSEAYLDAIKKIDTLISTKTESNLTGTIQQVAMKYRSFSIAEKIYQSIYN